MTTLNVPDAPKAIRETLCVAQAAIATRDDGRVHADLALLQRLINDCDRLNLPGAPPTAGSGASALRSTPRLSPTVRAWLEVEPARPSPPNPGRYIRPTGYLAHPGPMRHTCEPPMAGNSRTLDVRPDALAGAVWRCSCGRLWEVVEEPKPVHGQVRVDRRRWSRAGLLTRWRYRKAGPA